MRTKLFFAFILIIFLALFSNIVFERLIIRDFNDFLKGTKEDHIYWIMASVEGSFKNNEWDRALLNEALHWGLMLGFETYLEDKTGKKIVSTHEVLSSMSPGMLNRMNSFLKLPSGIGEFTWYPLYVGGEEVGKLHIRPIERLGLVPLKEEIFRRRGKEFLIISFLIACGGALFLAVLFTAFISTPIRRLTRAAEKIARGDFSVQKTPPGRLKFLKYRDEINRLTDSFNYMAEALRREEALRKHLTSNVAHELRTPLTIVKGNLDAIEDGVISDPNTAIQNIRSEVQRIITLVEGIEDITRAEASFFKKGTVEGIELKEFIDTIVQGTKELIYDKGLYIKTDGPAITVNTYPEKLHIILKNLLTNAYKFTDEGGITVTWGKYNHDSGAGFFISVEDTGKSIAKEEIAKVFDRFYKDADSGGKGLGLAIVKELTEVIGGKVEVESTPNQGSKFTLTF
ncbi:MAG: HAMP domain-containing histidine kinase [Thermodesulfovibrionia bacterium]|nr:HAMP domain-containing histidine kinase [Thermodesulfovibrionia bacterium]